MKSQKAGEEQDIKEVMQLNYCHELDKTWSKIDLSALSQATDLDKSLDYEITRKPMLM